MQKKSVSVLLFLSFAFLPVIPIISSFYELRNSVIFVQPVVWEMDQSFKITVPPLSTSMYEFRFESDESKWEPVFNAKWKLFSGSEVLVESPTEGVEWNLVRPFLELNNSETSATEKTLEMTFLNSNPEKYEVRLKISKDRGQILDKHTRLFIILLALSLGLTLLIWKPFLTVDSESNS